MLWTICMAGGFTALYVAWYNRMVDDDLVMWKAVQQSGIIAATLEQYQSWNTRWMSFLFLHTWLYGLRPASSLLFYHIVTFTALVLAFWRLVRIPVIAACIRPEMRHRQGLSASLLALALLLCTYNIADTWFWMNTSTMYGWNLIVLLFATGLVLQPLSLRWGQTGLLLLCGLYFGGASEPAVGLLLMGGLGTAVFRRELLLPYYRPLLLFGSAMAIGFLIAWLGAGHAKRAAALPAPALSDLLTKGSYFTAKIALWHTPLRLLLVFPLLYQIWQPGYLYIPAGSSPLLRTTFRLTAIGLLLLTAHTFFMVHLMGDYGPGRAWSHLSLLLLLLASTWLLTTSIRVHATIQTGTLTLVLAVILYTGYRQTILLPVYSRYLQEMNKDIRHTQRTTVPEAGLLHRRTWPNTSTAEE